MCAVTKINSYVASEALLKMSWQTRVRVHGLLCACVGLLLFDMCSCSRITVEVCCGTCVCTYMLLYECDCSIVAEYKLMHTCFNVVIADHVLI